MMMVTVTRDNHHSGWHASDFTGKFQVDSQGPSFAELEAQLRLRFMPYGSYYLTRVMMLGIRTKTVRPSCSSHRDRDPSHDDSPSH